MPKPKRRDDGRLLTMTYINFYVCNEAVIVPMFEDAADDLAQQNDCCRLSRPPADLARCHGAAARRGWHSLHHLAATAAADHSARRVAEFFVDGRFLPGLAIWG